MANTYDMTSSHINVPSQKFPVPKITMQTKSHNLNFNLLSSVFGGLEEELLGLAQPLLSAEMD